MPDGIDPNPYLGEPLTWEELQAVRGGPPHIQMEAEPVVGVVTGPGALSPEQAAQLDLPPREETFDEMVRRDVDPGTAGEVVQPQQAGITPGAAFGALGARTPVQTAPNVLFEPTQRAAEAGVTAAHAEAESQMAQAAVGFGQQELAAQAIRRLHRP